MSTFLFATEAPNFTMSCVPLTDLQCIGILALQSCFQALRMSFFRLAGSPGENDPKSDLNRHHLAQQLTAEWNPLGMVLILANRFLVKDADGDSWGCVFAIAANLFVLSRVTFTLRVLFYEKLSFLPNIALMMPMIFCYAATAIMGALLALNVSA